MEGEGRVEEGEACYLFTWTKPQTSLLAARDTGPIIGVIRDIEYLFHNVTHLPSLLLV